LLLAIDTATQSLSLALHDGRTLVAEKTWQTTNNHTVELTPAIQDMLGHESLGPKDLTGMAVCIGPGSYSGLRIGVAVAKGLALPLNLPVVGLSTLDILAAGQPQNSGEMIAVAQAGRGWIITGSYVWSDGRWQSQGEPQRMTWETLIASISGPAVITGEIDQRGHDALAEAVAQDAPLTVNPAAFRLRRAGFLAEEAWTRLNDNKDGYPASHLVPIYIQSKDVPVER
jgi:tRNA threonylcarbamoyladenosine biosynthesis protein TsaB